MLKSTAKLLAIGMMLSGLAAAQSPSAPAKQAGATATVKPKTTQTGAKSSAASPAKAKSAKASKTAAKPAASLAKKTSSASAAEKPKPSPIKDDSARDKKVKVIAMDPSRRDPFVNPIQLQEDKIKNTAACTTGARCLAIDQVILKGVVQTQAGMIAMVENAGRKQYNLREKDPVYNGFVLKITGDTIVFQETTVDNVGKATSKEVVKRVTVPAV